MVMRSAGPNEGILSMQEWEKRGLARSTQGWSVDTVSTKVDNCADLPPVCGIDLYRDEYAFHAMALRSSSP
jgi:hypothetical protein